MKLGDLKHHMPNPLICCLQVNAEPIWSNKVQGMYVFYGSLVEGLG